MKYWTCWMKKRWGGHSGKVIRECSLRKAIYPLHLTHEQRHMLDSTFQNIRTSIREYIESRESSEGRAGVKSQERRNTANRANEEVLETGEGTWSTENS